MEASVFRDVEVIGPTVSGRYLPIAGISGDRRNARRALRTLESDDRLDWIVRSLQEVVYDREP